MSTFDNMIDEAMGICERVFGDKALYFFKENVDIPFDIIGIFEAESTIIDTNGDTSIESRHHILCIRKRDFQRLGYRLPIKGDKIFFKEIQYEITDTPDDGQAEMRLILKKQKKGTYA